MGGLTKHQLELARGVADDVISPNADAWDREACWPEPAMRAMQAVGLGGLVVPQSAGGLGLGLLALTQVCEVLGRADGSSALCFGMHCVGSACIAAKATPFHEEHFLAPIAAGKHFTTLALSEPGTGSHFYLPQARIRREPDGEYCLAGSKCFVTNGGHADSYVLSGVDDDEQAPPGHFSLLVVPGGDPALVWGDPWAGWGMRGNSSRSVTFEGLRLPDRHRLGREGDQIWYVFGVVAPYFLVAMAGTYLGVASRAVHEARLHLQRRHYAHSGGSLAEVGVLQHKLGRVWGMLERSRQLCYGAASAADDDASDALIGLCAAKAEAAQAAVAITNECMSMVGGAGYRDGSLLQRLLRDARAADVMSPTTDILYTWIGRSLLGLPLLGD
jgi:alkylation response protein AidB-like acyl-CoA dehydrogenase